MATSTRQIQIISDEVMMLMALTRAYRHTTVEVISASSRADALQQIESFDFQLFLLDLDIRDESGFELLHDLSERAAGVPVILLTTSDIQTPTLLQQVEACRPQGGQLLLEKPFVLKKLTGAIERGLLERGFDGADGCHPELTQAGDLRRCHRFSRSEPVSICLAGRPQPPFFAATLTDIAVGGVGLATETALPVDRAVSFGDTCPQPSGVVVWSDGRHNHFRSGIRFV